MPRSVGKKIPSVAAHGGMLQRVVGTVDVDGKGTLCDLADLDPFLLVDYASMARGNLPPFGAHPHYGLAAVTLIHHGDHIVPWDNHTGTSETNYVGGCYFINGGKGVTHSEGEMIKCEEEKGTEQIITQIWVNPGLHLELPSASAQFASPDKIPVIQGKGFRVFVRCGEYQGQQPPINTFHADLVILRVEAEPASSGELELKSAHTNALVFVMSKTGPGVFGESKTEVQFGETSLLTGDGSLSFSNPGETLLEFLVLAGKPFGVKPLKLLGNNGALMGMDEAELRAAMATYEKDNNAFGK